MLVRAEFMPEFRDQLPESRKPSCAGLAKEGLFMLKLAIGGSFVLADEGRRSHCWGRKLAMVIAGGTGQTRTRGVHANEGQVRWIWLDDGRDDGATRGRGRGEREERTAEDRTGRDRNH